MAANRTQLQNALHKPYDRLLFSREVLSPVFGSGFSVYSSLSPSVVLPNKSESTVIDQVGIYGKIRLDDAAEIICYEILLQPKVRIEQSKVAIQQYVRKLLTAGQGALINFVSPSTKNVWRLTLVAKDSDVTGSGVKEKITNAKRYTFLLGPSETCRTAAERFEALSTEKEITFQSLQDAFSVERLSKAFFDEYTLHYQNFCDYLQESNYRKSVFNIAFPANAAKEEKDKASKPIRDFVKKMLGRIVFLYFVQKKGWLGASDTHYTDGPGDFIRRLFTDSGGDETFYSNWLTVLFFDTLNKKRTNDDFILPDGKTVKIPFLNGGLFDKEEFDEHLLTFPAKLFHNPDFEDAILTEKNKENARGFLDFLDAFNFTVYEDSPDDHTVAVDPEMLGHIFENLLEDNKDKGAFYTPKEIVHYMCQESLIEYLATGLQNEYTVYKELGNEQIELFGNEFRKGQLNLIEQLGEKGLDRDEVAYMVKQKDISKLTPKQLLSIDQLLDNVKICDPAIGSGAFPMGLLHEILTLKELIAYETGKEWNPAEAKLNIIQNSIYGVDIEKGAVDIARLRFWLSLVIDEELPKPLPNLDYKIVVGDSLISKFDGEIVEIDWERKRSLGKADEYVKNVQRLLMEVAEKQKQYFNPNNKNKKQLQAEIRNLKIELLINQLSFNRLAYIEKTPQKGGFMPTAADIKFNTERELQIKSFDNLIDKLKYLQQYTDEPFQHFDWKLDFPEVLNPYLVPDENQRGFDIVIGNPPWVSMKGKHGIEENKRNNLDNLMNKYVGNTSMPNLFEYFIKASFKLLKLRGIFSFIIPDRLGFNLAFSELRKELLINKTILEIVYKWKFETVIADTMTILYRNKPLDNYDLIIRNRPNFESIYVSKSEILEHPYYEYRGFDSLLVKDIINRIKTDSKPLSDFAETTSGFGGKSELITPYRESNKQVEVVKGKSIDRYKIRKKYYFTFIDENITGRTKDKTKLSKKEKILIRKTGSFLISTYDCTGVFPEQSLYFLYDFKIKPKFLLSLLNSRLFTWYYQNRLITNEDSTPQLKNFDLNSFPIKITPLITLFEILVNYILFLNEKDSNNLEQQQIASFFEHIIDGMVYELYFPELIEKYDCEIIKYLGELPEFTESMRDEEKMEICQKVYDRLSDASHPVRIHLEKMKQEIPEIRIIEGLEN